MPRSRSASRARTLDAAIELARGKTSVGLKAMRDNSAVQGLIGRTEGNLRAARAYLYGDGGGGLARSDPRPASAHRGPSHRAAPGLDLDHPSGRRGGRYRLSHGRRHRGVPGQPFERRFRDMHAIAQQIQARDTHYEDVGKAMLGIGPVPRGPTR